MKKITSRDNAEVKQASLLASSKDARHQQGAFVCEGFKLLGEAAFCGAEIRKIFVLEGMAHKVNIPCDAIFSVTESVLTKISQAVTPQGVVAVCGMPKPKPLDLRRAIALEDLRDPGNVGTILRCAEALSCTVVLLGDCADVFSPKVVRASAGSVLRVPIWAMTAEDLKSNLVAKGIPLYGAALRRDAVPLDQIENKNGCFAIGNESAGLSEKLLSLCDKTVIIPISGAESLNAAVAAAIIMWEARERTGGQAPL